MNEQFKLTLDDMLIGGGGLALTEDAADRIANFIDSLVRKTREELLETLGSLDKDTLVILSLQMIKINSNMATVLGY